MGIKRQKRIRSVIIGIFSIILAAVILAPPLWLFISSIANLQELLKIPLRWLPEKPSFERYREILFSQGPESEFRKTMWNSFFIALFVTIICVSLGSLAAYAFSRLRFPGKEKILFVLLFSYMLPPIAVIIPIYRIFSRYQMLDTKQALILIYSAILVPFVIWLMRTYFDTIPKDLEDAAKIDGCSHLGTLFRVIFPLSAPGIVATSLFAFLMSWEEFFIALILTSTPQAKTIPVAIAEFSGRHSIDFGMMATGGILAALPPILIAFVFQRYIVGGLLSGAVKG
ncbi:carbohydrate ABC transporter permease [Candidatus Sordicultor fermentans]|jgi:multiple sugar transport system permease protein|uniref:carbohydrate ABC transporter permease n=1 Tax=Candidatus Sordicultor fermentans TaxID=1953203 RepID=UPI001695105D|nr:carbohydrate ABC transporter permease [Atribacterota bacterium]NLY05029.1 carbohydrate ABC transporter permease [Candidatus Atribacteria bacterium]MDI9608110.1 carbohydrate ABC transporter permease [Atribacterota bacterium]HOA99058.1 carbohydrate ABC transporter permease [Candidatus Atribacteria bacterium]HOQ50862.1 carbohydrate ABC transporter permease [Candidatus Atribacteria bacterium]